MKVCFVQKAPFAYFGVMALSGYLRKQGISTDVRIATLETDLIGAVMEIKPDVIGLSVMTPEHGWLVAVCDLLKKALPDVPIVVGGVHAMLYSGEVLAIRSVDYVCTGEGELTLSSLCNSLAAGTPDRKAIAGLAYREDGRPVVNERGHLLEDLSGFTEDRELYYQNYPSLRNDGLKQFMASRGCPYSCSFCFNEQLRDLFRSKGRYLRIKQPRHLIDEIKGVRDSSGFASIFFADDLFTLNKPWLREFLPLYREGIGTPFMCTTRADQMDDETAALLAGAGCHTVSFGVETGNEGIRNGVLRKGVRDEDIVRCAGILKKHGIRIQTSNMFCLPGETLEDALDTVRLNIRIGTDIVFSTLFMPFPGTPLAEACIDQGYLPKDFSFQNLPASFLSHSILDLPDKDRIENVQRCSYFLVRYPALLKFGERVIRMARVNAPFYPLIFIGTFLRYKEERKISFAGAVSYLWRFRKSW